jgi:hypothetical protein
MYSTRTPDTCGGSCITCTCNPAVHVCLLCTMYQAFDTCRYKCSEVCSGDSCNAVEENCTRSIAEKDNYLDCRKICIPQLLQAIPVAKIHPSTCILSYMYPVLYLTVHNFILIFFSFILVFFCVCFKNAI